MFENDPDIATEGTTPEPLIPTGGDVKAAAEPEKNVEPAPEVVGEKPAKKAKKTAKAAKAPKKSAAPKKAKAPKEKKARKTKGVGHKAQGAVSPKAWAALVKQCKTDGITEAEFVREAVLKAVQSKTDYVRKDDPFYAKSE